MKRRAFWIGPVARARHLAREHGQHDITVILEPVRLAGILPEATTLYVCAGTGVATAPEMHNMISRMQALGAEVVYVS